MGLVRLADKVYLISAICYNADININDILKEITDLWGPISVKGEDFEFTQTEYYQKEMGSNLVKFYCAFEQYIDPMRIVDIKHQSNNIEEKYTGPSGRNVNIDPGYIETPKLVLATTKNFSHRIYLGNGIYGDVQLIWRGGKFIGNPWTYPDYLTENALLFFTKIRRNYLIKE